MKTASNNRILIYTPLVTSRLNYIFNFVFFEQLGVSCDFCSGIEEFKTANEYKFSYSTEDLFPDIPFIEANGLLQEENIKNFKIETFVFENQKAFFRTSVRSFFPFDMFSASFYLLSRYEEYLPSRPDKHGRYRPEESMAYKENFLEEPVIDAWIIEFKKYLLRQFPALKVKHKKFRYLPTIDIDNAFADLHKGILRTSLSLLKLSLLFNFRSLMDKIKVLSYLKRDDYDQFDYFEQIHSQKGIKPIYFILYSKYGRYDKNLPRKNKEFIALIKKIASNHEIGIHPSYQSHKSLKIIEREKTELESIIGRKITKSRQHFLKLSLPETYSNLTKLKIDSDYTMGYASMPGFRAGTCSTFNFFDLKKNAETQLKIFPLALMDATFIYYLKYNTDEAIKKIIKIVKAVKNVEGILVTLWHNENLGEDWKKVYEIMLNEVESRNTL
ncbi:MAG: polysaccharide deacetylase family protein [Bacteroidales bacterium]